MCVFVFFQAWHKSEHSAECWLTCVSHVCGPQAVKGEVRLKTKQSATCHFAEWIIYH